MRNKYILVRRGHGPIELNAHNHTDPFDDVWLKFWMRVFVALEQVSDFSDLTFYVVWDTEAVRRLPSYGRNVVVLLLMDEFCEIPPYYGNVLYVFKTHGFFPHFDLGRQNVTLSLISKSARDLLRWYARCMRLGLRYRSSIRRESMGMVVPLGYARQTDLPGKRFEDRQVLVSFIGSVYQRPYHPLSVRALLGTPKDIARSTMVDELNRLATEMPGSVMMVDTGNFLDGVRSDGVDYTSRMANTKIALAPRGSSVETFRLFEALRQGCVTICDRLPDHWFFRNCPAIQIADWKNLRSVVHNLISDPEALYDLHRRALTWWNSTCSEGALAKVMAQRLQRELSTDLIEEPR